MAGTDCDSKRINAGFGNKLFDFVRTGIRSILSRHIDSVFDTGKTTELTFDNNAMSMCILNDFFCQFDIVLEGMVATVDHNGSKAAVDAGFAQFESVTVVEVQTNGKICFNDSSFHQFDQIGVVGIFTSASRNLQDQRSIFLFRSFGNALDNFHVVDIESADSVTALVSLLKHFFGSYKTHKPLLLL